MSKSELTVVAAIFARGGSKGVPRKNLRKLGNRSLLERAIDVARETRGVGRVVVSTDDEEIAESARGAGADTPFLRPSHLAADDAPEWLAWRHLVEYLRSEPGGSGIDVLVSVPTTSPLRISQDVEACLDGLLRIPEADCCITVTEAARNPYFNMVRKDQDFFRLMIEGADVVRRQEAPDAFDITTVAYAVRADFVLQAPRLLSGKTTAVVVPRERALDIDTELDLEIAEYLWTKLYAQA